MRASPASKCKRRLAPFVSFTQLGRLIPTANWPRFPLACSRPFSFPGQDWPCRLTYAE